MKSCLTPSPAAILPYLLFSNELSPVTLSANSVSIGLSKLLPVIFLI